MAEHRAFMTHILQQTSVPIPPVQSTTHPALQAAVVPAIQSGPQLHSFGPPISPLRLVTMDFSTHVIGLVSTQPPVPPVSNVTTTIMAISVTAPAPVDPAPQLASESAPAPASTADTRSETDSDTLLVFALLPRPDAPPPPSSRI
jgi:hypothetical protein